MPSIHLETFIDAPAEVCFGLVRDVRIRERATARSGEHVGAEAAGVSPTLGETVTFEGNLLGIKRRLTVKVVELVRPRLLVDDMSDGAFRSFRHVHEFIDERGGTLMRDTLVWRSPFGILGRLADTLLIRQQLRKVVMERNARLKRLAETATMR